MQFILRMAARELRSSWRRLAFFFLCVAVGVGAIVALRSLIQNVRIALAAEARSLTGGDVYLFTDQPWPDKVRGIIDARLAEVPGIMRTETVDTMTMVHLPDERSARTKLVELRGVQDAFPFYGHFQLGGGQSYSPALLEDHGALVAPGLLAQLELDIGDEIAIGETRFTIRNVILTEPGRQLGAFSFGPRVLVAYDAVEEAGLLNVSSRADRQILLKVDEAQIDPLVNRLQEDLADTFVRVHSYRRTENRAERNLGRAENYLSLVGFVVVILGGIGVWSVTRVFIQQRLRSVAILKCLGATTGRVLSVYVAQVAVLGLGGSLLGVAVAYAALAIVPDSLTDRAAAAAGLVTTSIHLTGSAVTQGITIGVLISILFALVPLLDIRHVRPLLLLRQDQSGQPANPDWLRLVVIGLIGAVLVLVATWQAGSVEVGLYVTAGFAGVTVALHLIGRSLISAIKPLEGAGWFPLRHATLNLTRPGNQTRVILLAVGLGSFFITGIRAVQTNLLANFALELRDDTPDMFLIDIQQDQADGIRALIDAAEGLDRTPKFVPVLRARVVGVDGPTTRIEGRLAVRQAGFGREYTVTYRSHLEENERVVAGRFWGAAPSATPEVSIEERLHARGIQLDDTVWFDVLGREVLARVTSVRAVDWDDSRSGGFMFLFSPGAFLDFPHTYIAFMQGPDDIEARARLQRDIAVRYQNVSVIDGLEVIKTVRHVLDYVTLAITVVGGIALFSGGLILAGSVAMTKFQRLYEASIFKTLGANTRVLTTMYVIEYGALGVLAGIVGSIGAFVLTWVLTREVLEVGWHLAPGVYIGGIVITTLVVGFVGVVASFNVLRRKPLATLRAE